LGLEFGVESRFGVLGGAQRSAAYSEAVAFAESSDAVRR
jgi:hypothetical protein